ncbi:MAG: hypothetical protein SCALA701_04140 [Candidatus Scalindua sp.]|nr:MAG: hypothetical protein SCALA701_04140 [Candidatus Scalindua sp.]
MAAIHEIAPSTQFEIFTKVPEWFFEHSLTGPFTYHDLFTDIGLVQKTPLHEDLPKTLQSLDQFLPFDQKQIAYLAEVATRDKYKLIVCDIAPMGIEVARIAGIPSLLIENFTWDWIYQGYVKYGFQADRHIHYLQEVFGSADYHIQTEPVCLRRTVDLTTFPVCRKTKTPAHQIRQMFGIPEEANVVLITMGGIPEQYTFLKLLKRHHNIYFIIPGSSECKQLSGNLILLPHHSDFFHPDLINASDAVIGKIGYSTLAEVYHSGVPFGYVPRRGFCESEKLESFIKKQMDCCAITDVQFHNGRWTNILPELLAFPRTSRTVTNGATQIARFISKVLEQDSKS